MQLLMQLKPHPVGADSREEIGGKHPASIQDLDSGSDLPNELRRWELDTDWSQVPAFNFKAPPTKLQRALDQICAGRPFRDGSEELPLARLAALCELRPDGAAEKVLADWGAILRDAWSLLLGPARHPHLPDRDTLDAHAGPRPPLSLPPLPGGARRPNPAARPRKAAAYQQAALSFLVRRLGRDRLAAGARPAAAKTPSPPPGPGPAGRDPGEPVPSAGPSVFGNTLEVASARCR